MAKQKQKDYWVGDLLGEEGKADRLFDAFDDLVECGLFIKINKNGSRHPCEWTIQVHDYRNRILAQSISWNERSID